MFQIFIKKKFLIDYLNGFIDIHNHILPGIDDGAKTVNDSIQLIKEFSEIGIEKFIATPHIMDTYYPNTPDTINSSLTLVQNELKKQNFNQIQITAAAEHMIDSNFEDILEKGLIMPLNKNYILVEMSYLQPSINFNSAIQKIGSKRYFPILAHPERYTYLHKTNKYSTYKQNGILFQLNLLSLSNYYGKDVFAMGQKLLDKNMIDFIGSDIHNMNQMNQLKSIKLSNKAINQLLPIIEKTIYSFN